MRLAFISPFGFTPKATLSHRILPIAKALIKKGHEINIVIPPYTNPEDSGTIRDEGGVRMLNITLPGKLFYSIRTGLRMAYEVKRFNPEKVYIFKPKGYSALCGMFLRLIGKRYPFYLDIDDLESDKEMEERMGYRWWMRSFFRFQERWLLKRVEKVTVASKYLMKLYEGKIGEEKINYLPNGPRDCFAHDRPGLAMVLPACNDLQEKMRLQGKRVVLFYTRFTECLLKDIVDFVRLFSKKYPGGILFVVGEGYGKEREEVTVELKRAGLLDFVFFTGWVESEKLKDYLSIGEVAIFPLADTAFNKAKCSAKLIELMAMGIPIVANPVGEVITYIQDGKSGLLAKDTIEMVEKVIGLLQDREKAKILGCKTRDFIYNNFSWNEAVKRLGPLIA